ncbi:MAG: response regulator [Deltaproteobacteria bacterium]|nr:response regulator [Deltaproteobacteria bacterium]
MDQVLIVDDSVMLINYLEDALVEYKNKFHSIFAKDGLEAIEILKNKDISLVVTDLQMPKIDGLGLLAYINKYHASIPCIVMSAHGTPSMKETLQPDILQFIEKPFAAEALAEIIIAALKRDRPDGSLSGISIPSFLQMIEIEQKTCLFEVESPGNPKGFFYFKGGEMYHAVFGGLKGEEAAMEMMHIDNPTINFKKPPARQIPKKIESELTFLILEASRRKDEE